jgi:hypothetical protein
MHLLAPVVRQRLHARMLQPKLCCLAEGSTACACMGATLLEDVPTCCLQSMRSKFQWMQRLHGRPHATYGVILLPL